MAMTMRRAWMGALVWAIACTPAEVQYPEADQEPQAGAGAVGGAGGGAGFVLPPPPGEVAPPSAGAGGSGGAGDPVCAATRAEAAPVPVDLYIMEDQSGSMAEEGKWDAVRSALTAFVQLPAARGMAVGIGFFPRLPGAVPPACSSCTTADCLAGCGCVSITCNSNSGFCACAQFSSSSCFDTDYVQPAVPIGQLPTATMPIVGALEAVRPAGGTPTQAALTGAIAYARSWMASTGRRVAIALSTDGQPTNCGGNNSIRSISALARSAAADGLPIFVIGVGRQLDDLNAIAAAGGTTRAYLVEGTDVQTEFLMSLQAIQGAAARLSCSYAIPAPPAGQLLDPAKVNVELSGGMPAAVTILGQVPDRARCDARGGWHYDRPTAPTQIQLCESSCSAVNSGRYRKVEVTFGCRTSAID
jgi:hypothetical protein